MSSKYDYISQVPDMDGLGNLGNLTMARTQINGGTQIQAATITADKN